MQKTIFTKYYMVCSTLIIVSITILGALFLVFAAQYFKEDKYKLLQSNADRAATVAAHNYEKNQYLDKRELVDLYSAMSQTIDATFFVVNSSGRTILCTEKSPCNHTTYTVPDSVMQAIVKDGAYSEMGRLGGIYSDHYYTYAQPIKSEGNGRNIAFIFVSTHASQQLQMFMNEMLKMFLFSAIAVLVLTFIIIYFVTMSMVKPLRRMSIAAQKFGRGEFDTRLEITTYDEMGQLAMALNNMAQSLSTMEATRRSFTANVSHELKTPMTSIAGFIDGILDGTIPPEKHSYYLKIVSDETKRLSRLVRTMLNLAKIEAGEMRINKSCINIVEIICQTVFTFEQPIEKKQLVIRGLDHDKVIVDADPDLIHQVVYNLTENAVKFVNEGGYIEFSFIVDGPKTYVSVKNSGAGLSKDEIPKIFDRFYKTDKSRGLDKNGVGLGLYIVQSIINLHGGDIIVRSVEGEYSEFVFSLPTPKPQSKLQPKFKKS